MNPNGSWRPRYRDRTQAGQVLAERLMDYRDQSPVVLAIPNGGVAVAQPVAGLLGRPLHLLIVRKIQIPRNTEAGFGAVASDGTAVIDEKMVDRLALTDEQVEQQRKAAEKSVADRVKQYGHAAVLPETTDQNTIIIIDDGLASGATMEAGARIMALKPRRRLIIAAPTASPRAVKRLEPLVDDLICPHVGGPGAFAVAAAYENWRDVPDEEVVRALKAVD